MNRFFRKYLYGVLGGILLYIPFVLLGYLLYMPTSYSGFVALASIILAIVIVVITLSYKCSSVKERFLRTLVMHMSLWFVIILNGRIGTIRRLDNLLHIIDNEANSRAVGLGLVFFLFVVLSACVIMNILLFLFKIIGNRLELKKNKSE